MRFAGVLLLALLAALPAAGQPVPKVARVGILTPAASEPVGTHFVDAFRQGMREYGWEEGRNVIIEWRFAHGRYERLGELATELARLDVDVFVIDSTAAARAAMDVAPTVPIVMALVSDPVRTGLVASLARPGGNVTGMTLMSADLSGKQLELLKEVVPAARRVAVILNPANPSHAAIWSETQIAARALQLTVHAVEIREEAHLTSALSAVIAWRAEALYVINDPLLMGTDSVRNRILGFAARNRLPTLSGMREFTEAGGLISYGASFTGLFRRAAVFVDKILRGTKPGDLPIEQPTQFELVINFRTARALGLTIPESVLLRADHVIR